MVKFVRPFQKMTSSRSWACFDTQTAFKLIYNVWYLCFSFWTPIQLYIECMYLFFCSLSFFTHVSGSVSERNISDYWILLNDFISEWCVLHLPTQQLITVTDFYWIITVFTVVVIRNEYILNFGEWWHDTKCMNVCGFYILFLNSNRIYAYVQLYNV